MVNSSCSCTNLKLLPISALLGMRFVIPTYQRGYRWKEQQVVDLLDDIDEFKKKPREDDEIYCIQPLVVKMRKKVTLDMLKEATSIEQAKSILKGSWDVIDGQQRLTTIHILLSYLEPELENKYTIEYTTVRKNDNSLGSKELLEGMASSEFRNRDDFAQIASSNIDYFHICQTYSRIEQWFSKFSPDELVKEKREFFDLLMNKVQFIWYETDEADPIRVFTRLNIGKIALTDSELIKALFLNKSNFLQSDSQSLNLQQVEIATEWDKIEYTLQNDEFWLYIHEIGWSKPTRIDLIFDMISQKKVFGDIRNLGNDEHKTFRYFYEFFKASRKDKTIGAEWIREKWQVVKSYFQIFEEWYNDLEFYHYVGYLIHHGEKLDSLIDAYKGDKQEFRQFVKGKIKGKLSKCSDLDQVYGDMGEHKTDCRPLLLLHNIQTVINQNKELVNDEKYKLGTFYKFPFHLFKKEGKKKNGKGWEVEHIASNSGDNLESVKNQKTWLTSMSYSLSDGELKQKIFEFLKQPSPTYDQFVELAAAVRETTDCALDGMEKQMVWNFALLDSATNEEYQNDPFPVKRICLLAKEQGRKAVISYDEKTGEVYADKTQKAIAFVPPCTKNVFIKAYTDTPDSLSAWTKKDAMKYKENIQEVLKDFLS